MAQDSVQCEQPWQHLARLYKATVLSPSFTSDDVCPAEKGGKKAAVEEYDDTGSIASSATAYSSQMDGPEYIEADLFSTAIDGTYESRCAGGLQPGAPLLLPPGFVADSACCAGLPRGKGLGNAS